MPTVKLFLILVFNYCLLTVSGYAQYFSSPYRQDTIYTSYYSRLHMPVIEDNCNCAGYEFLVKGGSAQIVRSEGCLFFVRPLMSRGYIHIEAKDSNGRFIDYISAYVTDNIPLPWVEIYSIKKAHPPSPPRRIDSLICNSRNMYGGYYEDSLNNRVRFKVDSFIAEIVRDTTVLFSETNHGNRFSSEFFKQYQKMKAFEKFVFRNIAISDDLGNTYTIQRKEQILQ